MYWFVVFLCPPEVENLLLLLQTCCGSVPLVLGVAELGRTHQLTFPPGGEDQGQQPKQVDLALCDFE